MFRPSRLFLFLAAGCADPVTVHVNYLSADRHPADQLEITLGGQVIHGRDLRRDEEFGFLGVVSRGFGPTAPIPFSAVLRQPDGGVLASLRGMLPTTGATEYRVEIYATRFVVAIPCFGPLLTAPLAMGGSPPDTLYVFWGPWPRPFVC